MQQRGGGHIVNVSSVAGRQADLGSAVYNMTKWGVVGFSEALRQEALHSNIRVTVVEPGFVATALHGHNELPVVVEGVEDALADRGCARGRGHRGRDHLRRHETGAVDVNEILIRPTRQRR